jgi:hypothetical protein
MQFAKMVAGILPKEVLLTALNVNATVNLSAIEKDKPSPEVVAILQDTNQANIKSRIASLSKSGSLSDADWKYLEEHAADDVLAFVERSVRTTRKLDHQGNGRTTLLRR